MTNGTTNWRDLQAKSAGDKKVQLKRDIIVDVRLVGELGNKKAVLMERQKQPDNTYVEVTHDSIKGVFVGSMMVIDGWDSANVLYQSSPYFNVNNLVWLNDKNKSFQGQYSVEEAKMALKRKSIDPKVKIVVVLATEKGVVTVKTNASLWISLFNPMKYNDVAKDYILELVPMVFDPKDALFGRVSPEYYEKMTEGNFPPCVNIVQGKALSSIANVDSKLMLVDAFSNYLAYEESINNQVRHVGRSEVSAPPVVAAPRVLPTSPAPPVFPSSGPVGDDLPF